MAPCAAVAPVGARRVDLMALLRAHAGVAAVVVASAWWLVEVTRMWAGRDAPSVTVGAVLLAIAVALVRPDRVLPTSALVLAAAVSAGSFVVPLTAPTGWAGAPDAAIYACGAWLAITIAAVVVERPGMTTWLIMLVAASAPIEFMSGWLSWWGGADPTQPMMGTFYWHNPYAAFLVPGGLVGLALWIWRSRVLAVLGLVSFALASVGIVYSTSRAGLATFVGGVILVGTTAAVDSQRWRALRQVALAAAIAAACAFFVAGPPFFSHRVSPMAAEQVRSTTQSFTANGGQRLDFWREALAVFQQHPVTGGGYKSLVAESAGHVPSAMPVSPYAHNGYLQALGEGGLVLGVPFLLAMLVIAYLCLKTLAGGLIRRRIAAETVAVAIALACVMLHAGVDFDWRYPANFAIAGVLAGLLLGQWLSARPKDKPKRRTPARLAAVCALVGVALLGVSAWVMRDGNHQESLPVAAAHR